MEGIYPHTPEAAAVSQTGLRETEEGSSRGKATRGRTETGKGRENKREGQRLREREK